MAASPSVELEVSGRSVKVTNPDKVLCPGRLGTQLDVAQPCRRATKTRG